MLFRSPPPISPPPTVRSLSPFPLSLPRASPPLCALDAAPCTSSPLAFRRSSGTPPPFRAAFCKIFFQAREAFRLFCAVLPSFSVSALWLTRRRICTPLHAKKIGLFAKLCAVSILLRFNVLHTQKKFRFLRKKNLQKACTIQKLLLTLQT